LTLACHTADSSDVEGETVETSFSAEVAAHDRRRAAAAAAALAIVCWVFLLWTATDMNSALAQALMPMSTNWSIENIAAIVSMWAVMMAAMMLPSALPMIRTFVDLSLRNGETRRARAFVCAYIAVWSVFSLVGAAGQWALQSAGWLNPMTVSSSKLVTAALLVLAGVYQFSPLKRICLARCRNPIGFLLGDWRPGARGAWTMGLHHGLNCVGCCWALMALLFVGGVMNLAWVAALAIVVAIEKMAPGGERLALVLGVVLIAAGAWKLAALA
jgi:predicted metal-binding membrane protein